MTRTDGTEATGALKVALLQAELGAKRAQAGRSTDEVQAHFDDLWANYGNPETAKWVLPFGDNMVGWAMNWAVKDTERLQQDGRDVPDIKAWRTRVYNVMHSTDTLFQRDAWQALRQDPSLVPTAKELKAVQDDPAALRPLQERVWAAAHIVNPLKMGGVLSFDVDTRDLGPGLYKSNFDDATGRALRKRIEDAMEVAGSYVHAGNDAWDAMKTTQAGWKAKTEAQVAEKTAKTGAQPYGVGSAEKLQSRTGGSTPSTVSVRLKS